ncbi:MAG TPA: rhodanese-like domain-containing protein [Candidatus Paceibacterota bacterium]|nr:rhodanese-like domain-containing protein [Candidatus Paceibacterota bacterium]
MGSSRTAILVAGVAFVCVLGTALAIYLTPLKHFDLVQPGMNEMDPAAFYKAYSADPNQYLFIDVRTTTQYAAGHAQGAVNIPVADFVDEMSQFPKSGKEIALICSDGRLAAIAYGYLEDHGFTNLIHIEGGLQNWTLEGLPVGEGQSTSTAPAVK